MSTIDTDEPAKREIGRYAEELKQFARAAVNILHVPISPDDWKDRQKSIPEIIHAVSTLLLSSAIMAGAGVCSSLVKLRNLLAGTIAAVVVLLLWLYLSAICTQETDDKKKQALLRLRANIAAFWLALSYLMFLFWALARSSGSHYDRNQLFALVMVSMLLCAVLRFLVIERTKIHFLTYGLPLLLVTLLVCRVLIFW